MSDLRKRFGSLLAAHRKQAKLTQEALAALAHLSPDMISRIEAGQTGVRFASIEKLATALRIDPSDLFSAESSSGPAKRGAVVNLTARLSTLNDRDLAWVDQLLDAALKPRG